MTEQEKTPATWILVVSALFALMELVAGITLFFFPETMADQIDLTAMGIQFLMSMWATRQFALGVTFAVSVFRKSGQMLSLAYLFLLVMFLGDGLVGITLHDYSLLASSALMSLISATMLYMLRRKS
ncbi:MAG TPA: hypothetical protein PLX35_14110 [Cyclobacteriaceae bacterium]|nr:hypothetical protein [Cyclobacteriaceae bacterium]